MAVFAKESNNCVVIMYPTGGYGNFLYYLLSVFLKNTVKTTYTDFKFDSTGNSHTFPKYTEIFNLNKEKFNYTYNIDDCYVDQINNGKKFLVLADVGNLGDNVRFLKRYFPNATIIRTYAKSFEEKFLVWYNCISKTSLSSKIYKDSLHTSSGIAQYANKDITQITDLDAIECDLNFFKNNFELYGKFFNDESREVINIPIKSFFTDQGVINNCNLIADNLKTTVIDTDRLRSTAKEFINLQSGLTILNNYSNMNTLTAQALKKWYGVC